MKILLFLLLNFALGHCDLYFDRFNATTIPSARKASDTFVKAFGLVVPTGSGKIRNHIIPASLLNSLYVKLFESVESRAALVQILQNSMAFFKTKVESKPQTHETAQAIAQMIENMENTIDCLDESKPTIVVGGVELTGEDLVNYCCSGLNDLRALFEWNPGNLFLGPRNRLVDGGQYRDIEARHIFPHDIYNMNSAFYNVIIDYLDSGDARHLADIVSYNRRLLDASDEMAEIADQAIWINIDPTNYVNSMLYHVPEQYKDAMEQIRISNNTKLSALFNLEEIVNMENVMTKNRIYKEALEEQMDVIINGTARRFHDIPNILLEEYERDPYSESFNENCAIFFETIRAYFQPEMVVREASLKKNASKILYAKSGEYVVKIYEKMKRKEHIDAEISAIVDIFAELNNFMLAHVVWRINSGYIYKWTNKPSPWVANELQSGIFKDFPKENACSSNSDATPAPVPGKGTKKNKCTTDASKKKNKPTDSAPKKPVLKSVVSRNQKLNNIKRSVKMRVINAMKKYSDCLVDEISFFGTIQIIINIFLWRVMLEPIRDYHLTDLRLSVEYHNYERHAVSLASVMKDSCTINPKLQYHTWSDHLNANPQLDDVQNMGFSQFADGSYAQQLVSNDSGLNPASWRAVDLSFYIGLAVPLITNRMRRGTELGRPRQKLTHGLLYVDMYGRPVMASFRVTYNTTKSFYWTDRGWDSDPKSLFLYDSELSLASVSSDTFLRCDGIPMQHSNITSAMRITDEMLLREANLAVIQREFRRTVMGDGFHYKKFPSWREQYDAYDWSSIREQGEVMSGNYFKIWALGGFRFRHMNYGYYFSDGSFSIGISSKTIRNDDTDNWLFEAGKSISEWQDSDYYGQVFFDRNGRPVAIALMSPFCFFQRLVMSLLLERLFIYFFNFRCTWLFEYNPDNTWKWASEEWSPGRDKSNNPNSFKFSKTNVNY